jgi:hypothetical protein
MSGLQRRLDSTDPNTREYGKHKRELDQFQEDAFPDAGLQLWPKASDVMYSMTCDREEGSDLLVCLNCALGRCEDCPAFEAR